MAPSPQLRFDGQVAVVTGSGAGLGRQYALCLASRGCKVVVNDLGGTFNGVGDSTSSKVADQVVEEIRAAGGEAVANYDNVLDGERIVQTAVDEWGRVDILINNAGILRDVSLRNMKDGDWDAIIGVHLHGAYKTTRAAWPYMRKQKFGRIIQTTSASGLFGNFGQSNYAAAKVALVGFGETLAKEGAKYNITCNILAPGAASRLTQTVWTEEMMRLMSTSWVVPLPIFLVHRDCIENGSLFEAGAGHFAKIRWERSRGLTLKTKGLTPQHILDNWSKVMDFTSAKHPAGPPEMMKLLQNANSMPDNKLVSNEGLQLNGKVALVTGGGAGLGRAYAMELAKYGCKVMVCDIKNAAAVAEEIEKAGGEAKSTDISAERGDEVVKAVVDAWGRIDIAVNNAGILRDKSMSKMSFEEWTQVMNCHLRSTFKVTKAAFPYMTKQKFGRIVNVTSTSGIYGNFGQANYAAAKAGIVGFTKAIGREGQKYNIKTNVLAPSAGTAMTQTIWPPDVVSAMDPSFVSPVVALLCSAACPINGTIIEAAGGWFATTRWQRTRGVDFDFEAGYPSVEDVAEAFPKIVRFDEEADWPETPAEGSFYTHQNVMKYLEAKAKL